MTTDQRWAELFGFSFDPRVKAKVTAIGVDHGKDADTLEPQVLVYFQLAPNEDLFGVAITVELADILAEQLTHFAVRARECHWDPDTSG